MAFHAYAASEPGGSLQPFEYFAPPLGPDDVEIEVSCCGVCASDLHMLHNNWGLSSYPIVPGHEVVGIVRELGPAVTHLKVGDRVGVGWQSAACMHCEWCQSGEHELCPTQEATCVGRHGGFADRLRVDGRFAIPIPDALESEPAAPLLCAGITVFNPLMTLGVRSTDRVGVIGVGGLGHLALQFAKAFGCRVTGFSTTADKEADARRFGADDFVVSKDEGAMKAAGGSLDFILSTVAVDLPWDAYIAALRPKGTLCLVGIPESAVSFQAFPVIGGRRQVCGSPIGSPAMQARMLRFAARTGVRPLIEKMPMAEADTAMEKLRKNTARYRVVLTR